ncbi:MAG: type I-C CRISPR-associated protein Cas7/Csd2 [Spirochaetaceae bacterium]|jgi:CRISPR-associated protein Csd2|nr:type I-C CRISPR-associated protein Cas7/Csd2 [Spirochaetaceae bacterium]
MAVLDRKIDFALVFSVKNANPNGDPLSGNMPRITIDGSGELSDVCLKRKIRDRLQEAGDPIFVQSDDNRSDEYKSLKDRAEKTLGDAMKDEKKLRETACKTWIDVRSFGQLFAYKGEKSGSGVSVGIRGPVSIQSAFSVDPINITSIQITKSVSGEGDGTKKASDTMGMKHRVDFGLYATYGSMNPQLAERTGFSYEDALKIKQALLHIFDNDASSARPEGSMEVISLYWWEHNSKSGQYSSAKVHRSLFIKPKVEKPQSTDDYDIVVTQLEGLKPEVLAY